MNQCPGDGCTTHERKRRQMKSEDYYSKLTLSEYKNREGKKLGWKGTLHYYDAAELDLFGKPKRKTTSRTTTTKGKRAAIAELEEWHKELEAEAKRLGRAPSNRKSDVLTVTEAVEAYLKYQLTNNEIEKSTYTNQSNNLNAYIKPFIGSYVFNEVDTIALEKWLTDLHAKELSPNTIHGVWSVLFKTYRYYYKSRQIAINPCEYVSSPKKGDSKVTYLDDNQVVYLLECRDKEFEPGEPLWTALGIALYGGLRREEICGLRWQDVDFESGFLSIDSAIGMARDSEGKGFSYTKDPKNRTSKRKFPLIPALRKTLQTRYDYVNKEQGAVLGNWFVIGETIHYKPPTTLSTQLRRFTRKYDIREHYGKYVTLHSLRHNFATTGVNKTTMDIASLSQVMGHASKAMTLDTYSTATKDAVQIAMQKLGEAMNYEEE